MEIDREEIEQLLQTIFPSFELENVSVTQTKEYYDVIQLSLTDKKGKDFSGGARPAPSSI